MFTVLRWQRCKKWTNFVALWLAWSLGIVGWNGWNFLGILLYFQDDTQLTHNLFSVTQRSLHSWTDHSGL